MKKSLTLQILILTMLISSCSLGQVFGPTITPSPTITSTPTSTPIPTSTPEPTQTPIPSPTVEMLTGWQAYEQQVDLSVGSPMAQELDKLHLPTGYTLSKTTNIPEINGIVTTIGKSVLVHDTVVVPFANDLFSGDLIILFGIESNGDGSYTDGAFLVGVDSHGGNVGFGIPSIDGSQFDAQFRNSDFSFKPITSTNIFSFYKSLRGSQVNLQIPIWDQKGEVHPFNSSDFALSVFPPYEAKYGIVPGEAPNKFLNGLFHFAKTVCTENIPCNTSKSNLSPEDCVNPRLMRDLAELSPWGIFVSSIGVR